MLPVNNEMPLSMYEAKKTLNTLRMEYKKIHACLNDCILYRNELNDASSCLTCGMSRWKVNKAGPRNTKRILAKVLWYLPPIPRFKRMFQSPKIVKDLKWHAKGRENNGKLRHPVDSPTWQLVNQMWPEFISDCRNLRLFISANGINPHSSMISRHSCWPVLTITYNLLPWLCMKRKFMMLSLLISGPRKPEKNVCKSIIGTVLNIPGKTNDGVKPRLDLLEMGLRPGLAPTFGLKRTYLPPACYTLKKYFSPSIFDIMLHLTMHLVREVRLCGPVYMRWMYPFERYMKVLKGYVQNHNRLEGCIAECYIVEEALEFYTEYLSAWMQLGFLLVSDDISKKELIEKELKWLAQGPRQQVLTYPRYIINGCRYHIKERDEARVNQNSGVSIVASTMQIASSKDKNPVLGDMCFYGIVREIWDLDYNMFNICVFKCDWVDSKNGVKVDELGFTLVDLSKIGHKSDPFILAMQPQQVFYLEDQVDPRWSIVLSRPKMELFDIESDGNIADNDMEHHLFVNGMPNIKSFDEIEDYDEICTRTDCEGIWIEH
ncbi:hypothetical protein CK203_056883 [Vitis vinifera]|uniref:DUF4216 domain-containing protein n=1 Tax=Vitis vinifera TaxID=29760 RepID=A0A438GW58_VITVI|nr:hypothetical protein CK203_056883 [Vitis vinifera]